MPPVQSRPVMNSRIPAARWTYKLSQASMIWPPSCWCSDQQIAVLWRCPACHRDPYDILDHGPRP
ncbi:hypothetical protein [Streptomyces sp. NPDC051576]|uniref:hypothetical protein n=1 Tax=Streptomyces sp. NPDC051576 TaxID=3155803 RepID=UPI00343477BD